MATKPKLKCTLPKCNHILILRNPLQKLPCQLTHRGDDKSLSGPGRKQATATEV